VLYIHDNGRRIILVVGQGSELIDDFQSTAFAKKINTEFTFSLQLIPERGSKTLKFIT
jgi:hypothetical protein